VLERSGGDREDDAARAAPGDRALGEHASAARVRGWRRLAATRLGGGASIALLTVLAVTHEPGPCVLTLPHAAEYRIRGLLDRPGGGDYGGGAVLTTFATLRLALLPRRIWPLRAGRARSLGA
jgi:hypothetical protein